MRLDLRPWFEVWDALLAETNPSKPSLPAEDPELRSFVCAIIQGHARASLQRVRQGRRRHRKR
jgi:hypothetical protein